MKVGKWCGHRLPDALRSQVDECGQVRCPECLVMVTPCDVLGKPIPIRSGEAFTVTFRVCGLLDGAHFCLLEPGHDGEHLMRGLMRGVIEDDPRYRHGPPCEDCGMTRSFGDLHDGAHRATCERCGLSLCEPCGDAHSNYDCSARRR